MVAPDCICWHFSIKCSTEPFAATKCPPSVLLGFLVFLGFLALLCKVPIILISELNGTSPMRS